MKVESVPIDSIFPDPENARIHSIEQLNRIAKSLMSFSQQKPIVVSSDTNIIIAGNGTYEAAKTILKWKEIKIVRSKLSYQEARAYGIADNELSNRSIWDFTILGEHLEDISEWNPGIEWESLGFDSEEVLPLLESSIKLSSENIEDFMTKNSKSARIEDKEFSEMGKNIKVTREQRETIDTAISFIRLQEGDADMTEGRAIELLAADYLSGK